MNTQKKVLWITLICVILQICLFTTPAYADFTVPDISYPEVPSYSTDDFYDHMTDIMDFSDNSALLDYYLNNVAPADDGTWDNYHEHIFNIRTIKSSRYEKYDEAFHYLASQEIQLSCRCGELGEVITEQNSRDNHGLLEPHQMRNGRCIVCGYICAESGLDDEQRGYYKYLLDAISRGEDPLADESSSFYETFAKHLYNDGNVTPRQIAEIITKLRALPKESRKYEYLYLLGLFNYNLDINGSKGNHYSWINPDNTIQMKNQYSDNFITTFFHESGHATELNLWSIKNELAYCKFPVEDKIQDALTRDVENRIRSVTEGPVATVFKEMFGRTISKPEIDAVVNAFINGNEQEYFLMLRKCDSSIGYSRKLQFIYDSTRTAIEGQMKEWGVPKSNASMVYDVYGGVTNNKIAGYPSTFGHPSVDTDEKGNITHYWWENGKQTRHQEREAWAEFFSAKITNNEKAIEMNEVFFPESTVLLEQLADNLLDYYSDYYANVLEF